MEKEVKKIERIWFPDLSYVDIIEYDDGTEVIQPLPLPNFV